MSIQERTGVTFIVVTHDQEEAMTLSDRIAVMDGARSSRSGSPAEIYEHPNSRFVAGFIGSVNAVRGRVVGSDGCRSALRVPAFGDEVEARWMSRARWRRAGCDAGDPAGKAGASPDPGPRGRMWCAGQVKDLAYFGKDSLYRITLPGGGLMQAHAVNAGGGRGARAADWDDEVWLSFDPSSAIVLVDMSRGVSGLTRWFDGAAGPTC
jgi:putrescine transport system ATP-binding protein